MDVTRDAFHDMIYKRNMGIHCGITSFCTSNSLAIEAALQQGKRFGDDILIESTANQVNQFGGYTGMQPVDFRNYVLEMADNVGFPRERVILGGDHLGPLVWCKEPEKAAMEKAEELVRSYVLAGFKKIHLDTSMKLADDPKYEVLNIWTIAKRGARLYKVCEDAYQTLLRDNPNEVRPSFVIGSEVPIPGGEFENTDQVAVTKPEGLYETIAVYRNEFEKLGLQNAFSNIIAVVVQPGVEFGDENLVHYDRTETKSLCNAIARYSGIVMEGHSTDYQSPKQLKEMVEDGIAILKTGPVLTFTAREGLFALSFMEKELIPESEQSNFIEVLENVMRDKPQNWEKYYRGSDKDKYIKRRYSMSDRSRYYMNDSKVKQAMDKLFHNINGTHIPLGMLHQYMPSQCIKVQNGELKRSAEELVKDKIIEVIEGYNYATKYNYMTSSIR